MKSRLYLPLRFKILIALLFVVTAIVSVITFTMATMFHEDKRTYVKDLVSLAVMSAADESYAVVDGYASRLRSAGRALQDETVPVETRRALLKGFFTDFPELVGVAVQTEGRPAIAAVDAAKTAGAGVTQQDLEHLLVEAQQGATESSLTIKNQSPSPKLPCLLLTLPLQAQGDGPKVRVLALVKPDRLMSIATRPTLLQIAIGGTDGVLIADHDAQRVAERKRVLVALPTDDSGNSMSTVVTKELEVAGQSVIAGAAPVRAGGMTVTATVPAATAFLASRNLLRRLVFVTLGLLVVAALGGALWARRITGPMERLSAATGEIARGQFEAHVSIESADEIGKLGASFNTMAEELKNRDSALRGAQEQLVQSEKMAAFGVLGAGIAHEVKNPLAGILGCAQLSLRQVNGGSQIHANLLLIEKETKRCKTIIENLLRFARQENAVMDVFDVSRPLEDAMSIVHHQLELQHVRLSSNLDADLPPIRGNTNQLQQVFMNLLINAQQAMGPEGGAVMVSSGKHGADRVEVRVQDNGSGMPPEVLKHIFDPFFTTKPNGVGTGLGLSVTYGIIKDHGGEIVVDSTPGKGTTFTILLPVVARGEEPLDAPELMTAGLSVDRPIAG